MPASTLIKPIGRTEDGILLVSGVYKFFETHGLPLDIIFVGLKDRSVMPCWISFYGEALAGKMKHDRILAKLHEAIYEAYGPVFRNEVIRRLQEIKG